MNKVDFYKKFTKEDKLHEGSWTMIEHDADLVWGWIEMNNEDLAEQMKVLKEQMEILIKFGKDQVKINEMTIELLKKEVKNGR